MANNIEILINAKDGFSKTFGSFSSGFKAVTAGIAAGTAAISGAAAGLFYLTKNTADAYDKVQKFSDRIGISTEALSAYHYVAELSGVSQEALNMGFQRMTRRVAEAGQGTGVAVKALKELGISVEDINGKKPDVQFEMIAKALDNVSAQGDKARLAMQFFDSEGVALLQTMKGGSAGLKDMKEEAEKFGLVVSTKAGANAAAFNDSITRATGSLKGLKNYVSEEVMPTMTGLANRFADFVANNRDKLLKFSEDGITAFGGLVEFSAYGIAAMVDSWRGLQMTWQLLKEGFASFSEFLLSGMLKVTSTVRSALETMNVGGIYNGWIEKVTAFESAQRGAIDNMRQMADTAFTDLNNIVNAGSTVGKVQEIADKIKQAIADVRAEGDMGSLLSIPEEAVARTTETIGMLSEVQKKYYEDLLATRDEYYLNDEEKLLQWYEKQVEMHSEFKEAIAVLDDIYAARKAELAEVEYQAVIAEQERQKAANEAYNKGEEVRLKKISDSKVKTTTDAEKASYQMQQVYGIKGFNLYKIANIKETIANTHAAAMAAYKSLAGIPIIGPALGVAAAAAAYAYGFQQVTGIQALSLGGAAHGGLDYVPSEQTYLLDRGERVLSPNQNADLTAALSGGGIGGQVYIEKVVFEILPNATNANALLNMSRFDWESIASERVIPALRKLSLQGQTI